MNVVGIVSRFHVFIALWSCMSSLTFLPSLFCFCIVFMRNAGVGKFVYSIHVNTYLGTLSELICISCTVTAVLSH